jgi:hypothetical protein
LNAAIGGEGGLVSTEAVLGVLSLILWALVIIAEVVTPAFEAYVLPLTVLIPNNTNLSRGGVSHAPHSAIDPKRTFQRRSFGAERGARHQTHACFCPACNKAHLWRPREARYVEALH